MCMPNTTYPDASQDIKNRKLDSQKNDFRTTDSKSDSLNTETDINKLFSKISEKITELERENWRKTQRINELEDRIKRIEDEVDNNSRYIQNGWTV